MSHITSSALSLVVFIAVYLNCCQAGSDETVLDGAGIQHVEEFKATLLNSDKLLHSDDLDLLSQSEILKRDDLTERQVAGDRVQFTLNKIAFRIGNRYQQLGVQCGAIKTLRTALTDRERNVIKKELTKVAEIESEMVTQKKSIGVQWSDVLKNTSLEISRIIKHEDFKNDDKVWRVLKNRVVDFSAGLVNFQSRYDAFHEQITNALIVVANQIIDP